MADVTIIPKPEWARKAGRYGPTHPPVFDGKPTPEDARLALALIAELGPESQQWYSDCLPSLRALAAS